MSYVPVITITFKIQDFLGDNATNAQVSVRLRNFGSDNPRVPGSCIISTPWVPVTLDGIGGGSFTPIGNDVITPANTYYEVKFTADTANTAALVIPYQFTGSGTQDLSQIIPFNQFGGSGGPSVSNLVVKNPTGLQIISGFGLSVPQIQELTAPLLPHTAGGTDIGSASLPFANLYVGGAGTNNIRITGSATAARTFTLPDANSNPVQPLSGATAHQWLTFIDSSGVQHTAQPAYSDLTGLPQLAQTIASASHKWLASYNASTGLFTQTQPDYSDLTGTPQLAITFGAVAHQFLTSYNATTGAFTAAQPAFTDISGAASTAQIPNLDASKITTGTFATAQIPNLDVSKITTGIMPLAQGGTGVDLSASGGSGFVLKQNASHVISAAALVASDIPSLDVSKLTTGQLSLARGGTGADLSASGGTSQVLKQTSAGAAVTVGQLAFSDISGSVAASQLPNPTASTLGGIESVAAVAHQWIDSISTSGVPHLSQPAFSDISGTISTSQLPATYITNSAATSIVPKTIDASGDLGASLIWSGSSEVRIGTTTNILQNTSRLYVFGGSAGCNVDVQADGSSPGSDVAQVEVEGSDYATHINSIAIRYFGPTALGTMCGITAQSIGVLDFIGSTTVAGIIRTGGNFPLVFGTNDTERLRIAGTGELVFTNKTAPSTPASGKAAVWVDSTNKVLSLKDSSGTISNTVVPQAATAHQFVTAISAAGVVSQAQPSFADISGTVSAGQLPARTASINFTIDGGGSVPTTGVWGQISIPTGCTVTGWVLTADASGSAVIDVLRSTYSGFPTTSSIAGTDKPTLSSVQKNENLSISAWGSTALSAGDQLQVNLNSVTTCTRLNLTLIVTVP